MENSEQKKLDQQELKELYNLRDKLAQTMQPIFGEYQEQMTRIVFKKWTNKRIGQILGYSNIGRYLQSPNLNKNQPRQDAFNSLVAKVELLSKHIEKPVKENQRLRKIINFLGVASLLLFGLCGWLWISSKNAHNNYRLTNSERQAVMDLYSENIQMKLALEAVKFQSNYQKEVLRDSLPYHFKNLKKESQQKFLLLGLC